MNLPFEILQYIKSYLGFLDSHPFRISNKHFYKNTHSSPIYLNWKQYQNTFIVRSSYLSYNITYNLYHLIYDYKSMHTIYQIMFDKLPIPKHLDVFVHPTPIFNDLQLDRFILPYFKLINKSWAKSRKIPQKEGRNYEFLDIHHKPIHPINNFNNLHYILQVPSLYNHIHYLSIDNNHIEIKEWIPKLQSQESLRQRTQLFLDHLIHLLENIIQQFICLSDIPKWIKHFQSRLTNYYHRQPVFPKPQWIRCSGHTHQKTQCQQQINFQNHSSFHWYCHQHRHNPKPLLKPSFLIKSITTTGSI